MPLFDDCKRHSPSGIFAVIWLVGKPVLLMLSESFILRAEEPLFSHTYAFLTHLSWHMLFFEAD